MNINPVWYRYNGTANTPTDREYVGVIAQEYQKIAPYDVSPITHENDDGSTNDFLGVNDSAVKYMLVNAIKEQQAMIEAQAEKIAQLEEFVTTIGSTEAVNSTNLTLSSYDLAELDQNVPNPFNGTTTISYIVPTDAQTSQITVYGTNGQLMKTLDIEHVGQGTLTVNAEDLPAGTYSYQLIVDGKLFKTEKMVVTK